MKDEIVNKVAQSSLVTFNLEDIYPEGERVLIDIKDQLFQGLILREKDFRAWVKDHDWSQYEGKYVAITCSVDAIVQVWAYMLMQTRLAPFAKFVHHGSLESLERVLFQRALDQIDFSQFQDKPIVIKGCSDKPVPDAVYVEATQRLLPYAKKLSYGEPCSTVPLWKRK